MTGSGNHNFGKAFSEEHKKKMSDAIRDAKGGVSDENRLKRESQILKYKIYYNYQDIM